MGDKDEPGEKKKGKESKDGTAESVSEQKDWLEWTLMEERNG